MPTLCNSLAPVSTPSPLYLNTVITAASMICTKKPPSYWLVRGQLQWFNFIYLFYFILFHIFSYYFIFFYFFFNFVYLFLLFRERKIHICNKQTNNTGINSYLLFFASLLILFFTLSKPYPQQRKHSTEFGMAALLDSLISTAAISFTAMWRPVRSGNVMAVWFVFVVFPFSFSFFSLYIYFILAKFTFSSPWRYSLLTTKVTSC